MKLMKFIVMFMLLIFTMMNYVACTITTPVTKPETKVAVKPLPKPIPDYNKSKDEYVVPDFNVISSEFIDEYSGKYVVVDGYYAGKFDGPILIAEGRKMGSITTDMKGMYIYNKKPYGKRLVVIWHNQHREDARPLIRLGSLAKVRVYGYVIPPHKSLTLKNGLRLKAFAVPYVWLMRIVPLEQKN